MRRHDSLGVVLDINGVVSSTTSSAVTAAQEILELLTSVVPYAAASLQVWNPISGRHETLANVRYSDKEIEHLDTWFVRHDEAFRYMRAVTPAPLRWRDMPFDYRQLFSAQNYWIPAGYREGVTTCLLTPGGRYTGNLHLNTDSRDHPNDNAMQVLDALQTVLSGLTDALRMPGMIASWMSTTANAAIVRPTGEIVELPGRAAGPWLCSEGPLAAVLRRSFTVDADPWRCFWIDPDGECHRIERTRVSDGFVVTEQPAPLPYNLTHRELDVLTLLAEGYTNSAIAAHLTVTVKTAAKHIEHVFEKLDCGSRTSAAVLAVSDGLMCLEVASTIPASVRKE